MVKLNFYSTCLYMSPINFTNSSGLTIQFTNNELDSILTDLTAHDTYFTCGNNELVYIILSPGNLLVVDTSSLTNRKLFESLVLVPVYRFHSN